MKKSSSKQLMIFLAVALIIVISLPIIAIKSWISEVKNKEALAQQKLESELRDIPGAKVKMNVADNGSRIVTLEIKEKGDIVFWYGVNGLGSLYQINNIGTHLACKFDDQKEAYSTDLDLSKNGPFKKTFPFEINSVKDLVQHYDQILNTVQTIKADPNFAIYEDSQVAPKNQKVKCQFDK